MKYIAIIQIRLKQGILDPEGDTIKKTLAQLGYPVTKFSTEKNMVVELDAINDVAAKDIVQDMCDTILANPVLHEYEIDVQKV